MTLRRKVAEGDTPMGQWLRENKRLDSGQYFLSATDLDMVMHKFKDGWDKVAHPPRKICHVMIVEIKTRMAEPRFAQDDTLAMINQLMLRQKHYGLRRESMSALHDSFDGINKRGENVRIKSWGVHLLQMSGTSPSDSDVMYWDYKPITVYDLERMLRFDDNPFTRQPLSDRRHHKKVNGTWTS